MRLFANWGERLRWREVAPTVLAGLAVLGMLDGAGVFIKAFLGACGFVWG